MSEQPTQKTVQATPFQRFTIRLIDGKFVRVPKSDLPSTEPVKQATINNQTEMRDLYRLVNGRLTRLLNLEVDQGRRIGQPLPTSDVPKAGRVGVASPVPEKNG